MIEIIITLMILVVAIILLFWIKRALFMLGFLFKLFTIAMILCFLFSIWFGYQIIVDANDFKDNFSNSTNVVLVKDTINDTGMVAGMIFNPEKKSFEQMTKEQLQYFQNSYKDGEFDSINDQYYKIFMIDVQSFKDIELPDSEYGKINLTGEDTDSIANQIAQNDLGLKNYILSYYLLELFNPTNMPEFIVQLKSGGVKVYENTALFKAVKLLPGKLLAKLVD
ncbi:MAG TPA: hypothetical protein V6C58_12500 [Allocoleopsis sp.]